MKNLGKVEDSKDVTTKEYVDHLHSELDNSKLGTSDLVEYTEEEVQAEWNKIFI